MDRIDSNGDFYTNCWAMKPAGNIKNNSIDQIVVSEKFLKQVDDMFNKNVMDASDMY